MCRTYFLGVVLPGSLYREYDVTSGDTRCKLLKVPSQDVGGFLGGLHSGHISGYSRLGCGRRLATDLSGIRAHCGGKSLCSLRLAGRSAHRTTGNPCSLRLASRNAHRSTESPCSLRLASRSAHKSLGSPCVSKDHVRIHVLNSTIPTQFHQISMPRQVQSLDRGCNASLSRSSKKLGTVSLKT